MRLFIIFIYFAFHGVVFSNPVVQLYEITGDFFIKKGKTQLTDIDLIVFIIELREKIIDLGFEVPTLKEMIHQLDEVTSVNGISQKLMNMFFSEEKDFFEGDGFYVCASDTSNEYDYGNAAIGGCELLAAGLCAILPFGWLSQGVSLFFFTDGMSRILDDVSEAAKINAKSDWENIKGLINE